MLPTQRKSRSQSGKGRSHRRPSPRHLVACPSCGEQKLPHAACEQCGYVRPGLKIPSAEEA